MTKRVNAGKLIETLKHGQVAQQLPSGKTMKKHPDGTFYWEASGSPVTLDQQFMTSEYLVIPLKIGFYEAVDHLVKGKKVSALIRGAWVPLKELEAAEFLVEEK
jgi:hypothetical protein